MAAGAIGLLAGLAFSAEPVATGTAGKPDINAAKTNRWEGEVLAFEQRDRTNPPPRNAILFAGSSSIRLWRDLEKSFAPAPVFGRGLGGSQMADLLFYADRMIVAYAPKQVLVYEGDNDLQGGKAPEKILAEFKELARRVHAKLPATRIAFIAIKPSRARWNLLDKIKATNALVADFARTDARLEYIDVFSPMLDAKGVLHEEFFANDGLHLNPQGYALWTKVIEPRLMR